MKTNYPGITTNTKSIRIDFSYKGKRHRETLSIPPTSKNIKHAAHFLEEIKFAIAFNRFSYAHFFSNNKYKKTQSEGVINEKQLKRRK